MNVATDLFDIEAPPVPLAEVERIAAESFGIAGRATPLSGERDQNFHLRTDQGPGFVFKVHPPAEDPAVVEMQILGLQHLAAVDPALAVPRVIPTLDGATSLTLDLGAGRPQRARLLSYLPGVQLEAHLPLSPPRLRSLGSSLARLNRALAGFSHPAGDYVLLWDIQRASQVRAFFEHIWEPEWRALAARALDRFETEVAPRLAGLRRQIIHNDCNPYNVLYDAAQTEAVGGILDFGDMIHASRVQEIAVAASYNPGADDVLAPAREIAAAYCAVLPLPEAELALLPDLIATRAVLSLSISSWHLSMEPEDREAQTPRLSRVADRLRRLLAVDREAAVEALLAAVQRGA